MHKISLLLMMLILSSCSTLKKGYEHLTYKSLRIENFSKKYKAKLFRDDFKEDMLLLRYALDKGHGGKHTIRKGFFRRVDRELRNLKYTKNSNSLCKQIGKILSSMPDQHLKAKYNGKDCFYRNTKKTRVGKNRNNTRRPWKGLIQKDNIYTIAISRFTPGKWPGFHKFIDEALLNAKVIIIDLRGNRGGDDSIGLEMAEKLAGQKIKAGRAPDIKRQTAETLTIWQNKLRSLKAQSRNKNVKKKLSEYLKGNSELLDKAVSGKLKEFHIGQFESSDWKYDPSKGFQGPIYILQDKNTGSSAESTIDFFEYFPNVKRVGSNTSGTIHFGNVGMILLPNSGIQVNIPTKANRYKDGRFIEFIGIKPDIALKDRQNAYDYILNRLH